MQGRIHSIQSLGTLDGPGLRFAVFLQGCPLRCKCCHNPDTWDLNGGSAVTAEEIANKAERYKDYFGEIGGITLSGGEPLLQAEFATEIFALCREKGINTCLDTSGCILNEKVKKLLDVTDRVLLDIKYTEEAAYRENAGCALSTPLEFLSCLNTKSIKTTLRQVIIPSLNDSEESVLKLKLTARSHPCVDGVELLPFKKICQVKYDRMGISFPLSHIPEPTRERMEALEKILNS